MVESEKGKGNAGDSCRADDYMKVRVDTYSVLLSDWFARMMVSARI